VSVPSTPSPNPQCSKQASETRLRAVQATEQGRLRRAATYFERADAMCPDDRGSTLNTRLSVLVDLGRFEQARTLSRAASTPPSAWASMDRRLPTLEANWNATTSESLFDLAQQQSGREPEAAKLLEQSFERARQISGIKPEVQALDGLTQIVATGLSPDSNTLTVADRFGYGRFDLRRGIAIGRKMAAGRLLALSSNGAAALIMDPTGSKSELHCLDTISGQLLPPLVIPDPDMGVDELGVGLSSDGTRAAAYVNPRAGSAGSYARTSIDGVLIWDCRTGQLQAALAPERGYGDAVSSLAFSPSGKMLAIGGRIGTVVVWDIEHKSVVLQDSTTCQCDATELLSLSVGQVFWALNETVLLTQSSDPNRRLFYPTKRKPIPLAIPAGIFAVLDDGHAILSDPAGGPAQSLDLVTGKTGELTAFGTRFEQVRGPFVVRGSGTHRQVKLSQLASRNERVLTVRHSGPFESIAVKDDTLLIGGRSALRFALPRAQPSAAFRVARGGEWGISHYELWDAADSASDHRPWLPCEDPESRIEPRILSPSAFVFPCGTELVFATATAPGVVARLRHIEGTNTAYALFADGTAELFGNLEDLRRVARCAAGALSYPLEVCEEELLVPGKLQALIQQRAAH
jgi:WD40 repeat protein